MKRIYLVKKDPLMPPSEDNWIVMEQQEYIAFANTPEGKLRKKNFAQLDGTDVSDVMYFIESDEETVKAYRKDKDEHDYLREQEDKYKTYMLSLDSLERESDYESVNSFNKISVSDEDVVAESLMKSNIETLKTALSSLDADERMIIERLYLDEKTVSARELSKLLEIPQKTLHYRKTQIFKKIRNFF